MAVLTRYMTLLAALFVAVSLAPVLAGVLTERWVLEVRGDTRVMLGPTRMEICDEGTCREVIYSRSIADLRTRAAAVKGFMDRERLEAAMERVQFNRKKGLQILVPGLVIAGLLGAVAVILLWLRGRGTSQWTRGTIRFVTSGLALGLMVFALVYAAGISHLPADGTRIHWGSSFYLVLGGSVLALLGGMLAGMGSEGKHAPSPGPDDAPPAA